MQDGALDKILDGLPTKTYRAGETILTAGSKTGQLMILQSGAVAVFKGSIEIAKVRDPGAILGELSALLDGPHTADVKAIENSQFRVADGALLGKNPVLVLHVAKILAQRLVAVDDGFVELKKQLQAGQPPSILARTLEKIEKTLSALDPQLVIPGA